MKSTTKYFDVWKDRWPHLATLPYPQPGDFVMFYFQHQDEGIYLDIGAHDGIQMSNTIRLEIDKKWNGICFEPNPVVFEQLKKNRSSSCFPYAVCDTTGEKEFLFCTGYTEMLSGLEENYEAHHRKRIDNEISQYGGKIEKIKVPTISLKDFFKGQSFIDYVSIDTEGSELSVLNGIDFSRTYIRLISLEDNRSIEVESFLNNKGYKKLIKVCGDCFYER